MIITQSQTETISRLQKLQTLSLSIPENFQIEEVTAFTPRTLQTTRSECSTLTTLQPLLPLSQPELPPLEVRASDQDRSRATTLIRESCFQCSHLGLRCSFTSTRQHPHHSLRLFRNKQPQDRRSCSRCSRNKEDFCILQDSLSENRNIGIERGASVGAVRIDYEADGVEKSKVLERVKELEEERWMRFRWALPTASKERRERLKPVVGLKVRGWLRTET